jgi:hypothetical protein
MATASINPNGCSNDTVLLVREFRVNLKKLADLTENVVAHVASE